MNKFVRLIALLTLMSILLTGCSLLGDKEYTCQELTLTVPGYMGDVSSDSSFKDFTFALDSHKIAIFGIKEPKSDFEGTIVEDLEDYANVLIEGNELDCEAKERSGGDYLYFTYEASSSGTVYGYICAAYETEDAYWLIQVAAEKAEFDEADFLEILDSAVFG